MTRKAVWFIRGRETSRIIVLIRVQRNPPFCRSRSSNSGALPQVAPEGFEFPRLDRLCSVAQNKASYIAEFTSYFHP